ncbi:hypothetical protein CVT25_015068 [Psilocybe cyanescens]|uniref:Uncharacterized protein n=1 Tax=Psilocybe cyanescens TaxID=93625 RepID=A0A409WRZ8_PSICY|nr:hypothetical protein CVT25_015068 [Psilocybe cyanescens]
MAVRLGIVSSRLLGCDRNPIHTNAMGRKWDGEFFGNGQKSKSRNYTHIFYSGSTNPTSKASRTSTQRMWAPFGRSTLIPWRILEFCWDSCCNEWPKWSTMAYRLPNRLFGM